MSDDTDDLSVGKRIQNVKMEYDKAVDDHARPKCDLCGEREGSVRTMDVQNEQSGAVKSVDLCAGCRELTERYNRGEDVEWPVEVTAE